MCAHESQEVNNKTNYTRHTKRCYEVPCNQKFWSVSGYEYEKKNYAIFSDLEINDGENSPTGPGILRAISSSFIFVPTTLRRTNATVRVSRREGGCRS